MLKLRINPIVAKDLKNIRDYIAEDNEGEISGEAVFIGWDKNRGGEGVNFFVSLKLEVPFSWN